MKHYSIVSKAGACYGVYTGASADEAFAAMVAEGGGKVGSDEVGTVDDWCVTEVDPNVPFDAPADTHEAFARQVSEIGGRLRDEINRLYRSGAVRDDDSPGLVIAVAAANVADGWRSRRVDRRFNVLRRI